jgi:hypothetical protein
MAKMKEQLQPALEYVVKNQEPSASATLDTVSLATSSTSDVAASGFIVILSPTTKISTPDNRRPQ